MKSLIQGLEYAFVAGLYLASSSALAGYMSYTNLTDFLNAVGSPTTLLSFEAPLSAANVYTEEGATFTANGDGTANTDTGERLWTLSPNVYSTTGLTSRYLNNNYGAESLSIEFATGINAISFEIGTLYDWGNAGGSLTQRFGFGGVDTIDIPTTKLSTTSNPLSFVGFVFDHTFTSVEIYDAPQGIVLDNLRYAARSAPAPAPAPATLALFGLGLAGLGYQRRKRLTA